MKITISHDRDVTTFSRLLNTEDDFDELKSQCQEFIDTMKNNDLEFDLNIKPENIDDKKLSNKLLLDLTFSNLKEPVIERCLTVIPNHSSQ